MPKKRVRNSVKCSEFIRLIIDVIFGEMRMVYSVDCGYVSWVGVNIPKEVFGK